MSAAIYLRISQDRAGLRAGVLRQQEDWTRKLDTVTVTLDRTAAAVLATDPAIQVLATSPKIRFSVNLSAHTGDTFVAHFRQA
jgi:hypothetical protein